MFYENKHDDPLVRTIFCQDEIFSVLSFFFPCVRVKNLDCDEIVASRLNRMISGSTLTPRRLIITYCDLINCSIWPNLAEYAKDVYRFEKERKKKKRRITKKKNEKGEHETEKWKERRARSMKFFDQFSFRLSK